MLAITIDGKALLDSAAVGLGGALVLTIAFSVAVLAFDRARGGGRLDEGRSAASTGSSLAWSALAGIGGLACIGIVALGVWAMTQK